MPHKPGPPPNPSRDLFMSMSVEEFARTFIKADPLWSRVCVALWRKVVPRRLAWSWEARQWRKEWERTGNDD